MFNNAFCPRKVPLLYPIVELLSGLFTTKKRLKKFDILFSTSKYVNKGEESIAN